MSARLAGAVLAGALALSGCATIERGEGLGNVDTFAKCATADVVTTTIGLASGGMVEGNPLTQALTIKALGDVAGVVVPLVGLSIAAYYLLKYIDRPVVTAAAAGLTCAAAVRNIVIIQ